MVSRAPHMKNWKSSFVNCFVASKAEVDVGKRWDLRNIPKNVPRQIAQKDASKLEDMFRLEKMQRRMTGVMGSFWCGGWLLKLLIPLRRVFRGLQLFSKGLGRPNCLCKIPITLRYWLIEETQSEQARKAVYGFDQQGWYGMFVACGIWCLAGVSSVSPSSEQTGELWANQCLNSW